MSQAMFHIIDDFPDFRALLKELVAMAGYSSMQFDSAESYLDHLHSDDFQAPVAILTDFRMPGKNGFELIKCVREKLPRQKAVIISATSNDALGREIDALVCYTLPKPFKVDLLFELLSALVDCNSNHSSFTLANCQTGLNHSCPFCCQSATIPSPACK